MSLVWLWPRVLPVIFFLFVSNAHAVGIEFVTPVGGATWPAGPITVSWKDAGGSPDMSQLVSYTLQLMVGGNLADNSQVLQTIGSANAPVNSGQVMDTIPADIAQSVENGFYLRMTSNTTTGNQVINYSDRFTLINMNGTTDSQYLDGANAAVGISNVPEAQYNVLSQPTNTNSAPTSATSTADTSTSASATVTATTASTPTPTDDNQASVPPKSLIAGLSLGLLVALIIIVGIVIWALVRWRRQRKQHPAPETTVSDAVLLGDKAELPASTPSTISLRTPVELSPTEERYEIGDHEKVVEADGTTEAVFELEGDWGGWEAASGRRSQAYDPTR